MLRILASAPSFSMRKMPPLIHKFSACTFYYKAGAAVVSYSGPAAVARRLRGNIKGIYSISKMRASFSVVNANENN